MSERRLEFAAWLAERNLGKPDERTMHDLWQIVDEGVLGASVHVSIGMDLIRHLLDSGADGERALQTAIAAGQFIAATRGRDTPVIGNSIALLLKGLEVVPMAQRRAVLAQRAAAFGADAARRKAALVVHALETLNGAQAILAYDYSSTVAAIVIALAHRHPVLRIVVPESRAIAGGLRYVQEFAAAGLAVRFLPDAAMDYALQGVDAVLLGVETLRADGSFLNTIGSRMAARTAQALGTSVYGCTDLLKLDQRSYAGTMPDPAIRDYSRLLLTDVALPAGSEVCTDAPELEVVPASLVTAILTEFGALPPGDIAGRGKAALGLEKG